MSFSNPQIKTLIIALLILQTLITLALVIDYVSLKYKFNKGVIGSIIILGSIVCYIIFVVYPLIKGWCTM